VDHVPIIEIDPKTGTVEDLPTEVTKEITNSVLKGKEEGLILIAPHDQKEKMPTEDLNKVEKALNALGKKAKEEDPILTAPHDQKGKTPTEDLGQRALPNNAQKAKEEDPILTALQGQRGSKLPNLHVQKAPDRKDKGNPDRPLLRMEEVNLPTATSIKTNLNKGLRPRNNAKTPILSTQNGGLLLL
jgi:hypothetical protein